VRFNDVGIINWYYIAKNRFFHTIAKSTLGFIYSTSEDLEIHKLTYNEGKTEWTKRIEGPLYGGSFNEAGIMVEDPDEPGKLYLGCRELYNS